MFILLQKLLPQHLLSRLVGFIASSRVGFIRNSFISWAITRYNIDLTDAEQPNPKAYRSFNDFFTRALKPAARPIQGEICSPADGAISECGDIVEGQLLQAKGLTYTLTQLLATEQVSDFQNGSFSTIYLSPRDYHRVHCPMSGELIAARYVPGDLFSVNQQTAEAIPNLFARNERLVMQFKTNESSYYLVMVGAMIVAGIQPVWRSAPYPARRLFIDPKAKGAFAAGDEIGRFLMGSTAIVITEQNLKLKHQAGDAVKMGELLIH